MANWWDSAPVASPLDAAIQLEGIDPKKAAIAQSIYHQESASGANTATSNAGAVGGMQVIPATFQRMADPGWDINDPVQNARAGLRYVSKLYDQAGGDPKLTAAGYYGGEGAIDKARKGIAVSDPRNPGAPNTLQYGDQVASRLPQQANWWDSAPVVDQSQPTQVAAQQPEGGMLDTIKSGIEGLGAGTRAFGAGLGEGTGQVGLNAQKYLGKGINAVADYFSPPQRDLTSLVTGQAPQGGTAAGNWLVNDADQGLQNIKAQAAPFHESSPIATGAGELGGNIGATLPVGGLLAKGVEAVVPAVTRAIPAIAPYAAKLANALRSSGMSVGGAPAESLAGNAANLGARMLGGAGTGYVSAGLIDPDSAEAGAITGAALPPALKGAGYAGGVIGDALRPFFAKGQGTIVGSILRQFATDPQSAAAQMGRASAVIPGSEPIAATAAGDTGIASLSRAMQNADPRYAAELQARQTAQNQARTTAVEAVSGNQGRIDLAKQARDQLTAPMREAVLDAAGDVPADPILKSIDRLIGKPDNAGKISQQALNEFRGRIAQFTQDGNIDSRALYAIRKDIGDVLSGKLQGESGNLKYASSQLIKVRDLIDDSIDMSSRRVSTPGTALMPGGVNIGRAVPDLFATGPRPTWKDYLKTYSTESIPINQMNMLDDVLKRIQTGTVDTQGSAILSAPKLNNILKNETPDLTKVLSQPQMDLLRNLAGDLNASQIASNAGRAVGSNTLQNMAQNNLLSAMMGKKLGGSSLAQTTLGRALQIPYGMANKRIMEQLGNALLNPSEAAQRMQIPANQALANALMKAQIGIGKSAPAITAGTQ